RDRRARRRRYEARRRRRSLSRRLGVSSGRAGADLGRAMIKLEKHGLVATLTLNRPESRNALGEPGDGDQVAAACAEINADRKLRCAILTGAGKAFSAGGNIKAMQSRTG